MAGKAMLGRVLAVILEAIPPNEERDCFEAFSSD